MHTVQLGTLTKKVPATWNELEWPLLRRLLPVYYGAYARPVRQRLELLRLLLGISIPFLLDFTPVQLLELDWLTDFLLKESVALTRQLLPTVQVGWHRLHGPAERLANLRFVEFVFADSFFVAYCQSQDVAWLDKLLAVLYRPAAPWPARAPGDRRRAFDEHRLGRDARRAARLPRVVKQAIYTWYLGCRHHLADRYPLVFTGGEGGGGHPDGWAYVWREVSGGPFGDFGATGQQYASLVLAKMQDDLQRAVELKKSTPA